MPNTNFKLNAANDDRILGEGRGRNLKNNTNTDSLIPGVRTLAAMFGGLGEMFNGNRKLYQSFGYRNTISYEARLGKYSRQGLASRIVDAEPNATWANPPKLISKKPIPKVLPTNPSPEPNADPATATPAPEGSTQPTATGNQPNQPNQPNTNSSGFYRPAGGGGATHKLPPESSAHPDLKDQAERATAFEKAWNDVNAQHSIWPILNRADKLAGMGRFSILVFGFSDGGLDKELKPKAGMKLLYIQPYSEANSEIIEYEDDPTNERFGKPKIYAIKPFTAVDGTKTKGISKQEDGDVKVHWTKVVHIAENVLEDPIFGTPRIDKVFNDLDDLQKISGGAAETYWLTANRGIQVDVDKDVSLGPDDVAALQDEVNDYTHNLSRVMRTRGVTVHNLGTDVADPSGPFDVIISLIAGASGIPQRILLGAEAGQLASEQDRANWAVRIDERRINFAEPVILIPTIKLLIKSGVLPAPKFLDVLWPDAFKMSPLERAQASAQKARTLANVAKALSDTSPPIDVSEGRALIGLEDSVPLFDETNDSKV